MKIREITENIGKALRGEKSAIPGRSYHPKQSKQEVARKQVEQLLTRKR